MSVTYDLKHQLLRMLATPSTRSIIYDHFCKQKERFGEAYELTIYGWRLLDAGEIHKSKGCKVDWTSGLVGLSCFEDASKRLASCLIGVIWTAGDKAPQFKAHCAPETRRCLISDRDFQTFEEQIKRLEEGGVDDPWEATAAMPNLGNIKVSFALCPASGDAAQCLSLTSRSVRSRCAVWGSEAPLTALNYIDPETGALCVVGVPNARRAQHDGLGVEARKRQLGCSGKPMVVAADYLYKIHHGRLRRPFTRACTLRTVPAPLRHRRASSPSSDEVGGFFFDYEPFRTTSAMSSRRCRESVARHAVDGEDRRVPVATSTPPVSCIEDSASQVAYIRWAPCTSPRS